MFDIEFEAQIENGMIIVPIEYQSTIATHRSVKITIPAQNKPKFSSHRFIQDAIANPVSVPGIRQMTRDEIHDR
jgi:hypothetical protein